MNTFLPYPDYQMSAKVLDNKLLGKQRVEVIQILNAIHEVTEGWSNHPAAKMWSENTAQLCEYGFAVCDEWISRGFQDNYRDKIREHLEWLTEGDYNMDKPFWFGDMQFHLAHQSNLMRKDAVYYGQFFGDVPADLPYVWPIR